MSGTINDDDLALSAVGNDRLGGDQYADQVAIGGVRGSSAVKSIFSPANRKRLIVYAVVGAILFTAIVWAFFLMEQEEAVQGGVGKTSARMSTVKNNTPSALQREEAERYNTTELALRQEKDSTAHPVILMENASTPNPFAPQATVKEPGRITDVGRTEQTVADSGANSSRQARSRETKDMDDLVKQLIEAEGAQRPELYKVTWGYQSNHPEPAIVTQAAPASDSDLDAASGNAQGNKRCAKPVIRAADMHMATTDLALNSDVGGPVSLTIRDGKARGTRLIGSFERREEWVRMDLTTMVIPNHTLPVKAIGLDIDTTLNAVQGDVDRHVMYRYGWWGIGTTLKAIGKAAESNADSTVVVSDGVALQSTTSDASREAKIALGSLGQDLGDVMRDRINRPITVSLRVGDEVGVFFMEDVCLPANSDNY